MPSQNWLFFQQDDLVYSPWAKFRLFHRPWESADDNYKNLGSVRTWRQRHRRLFSVVNTTFEMGCMVTNVAVCTWRQKENYQQECIPVGCVPPAHWPYAVAVVSVLPRMPTTRLPPCTPPTMHAPQPHMPPRPCMAPACVPPTTHAPLDRITNTWKYNLAPTSLRAVKIQSCRQVRMDPWSDPSDFAKVTRVSWTYLGVVFEQLSLSVFGIQYKCS